MGVPGWAYTGRHIHHSAHSLLSPWEARHLSAQRLLLFHGRLGPSLRRGSSTLLREARHLSAQRLFSCLKEARHLSAQRPFSFPKEARHLSAQRPSAFLREKRDLSAQRLSALLREKKRPLRRGFPLS